MMFYDSLRGVFTELLPQQNSRASCDLPVQGWNQEESQWVHTVLDRTRSWCSVQAVVKASELWPTCKKMGWQCFFTRKKPEVDVEVICIWKGCLSISGTVYSYRIERITAQGLTALQNPTLSNGNAFTLAIVTAELLVVKLT